MYIEMLVGGGLVGGPRLPVAGVARGAAASPRGVALRGRIRRHRASGSPRPASPILLHGARRLVPELHADLHPDRDHARAGGRVRARRRDSAGCASRLTARRCGRAGPASATTRSTCCIISRRRRPTTRSSCISNRPIDTTRALPPRVRVAHVEMARAAAWCGCRCSRRATLGELRRRRRALHQRHAAAGLVGADGRDDSRHEPDALSALPPAAPRAAQPAAGRHRRPPRRRHHHGVGERAARHRPALPAVVRIACTSCTKRRRRRSGRFAIRASSNASGAGTGSATASSCTSGRSSRARTCRT